LPIADNCFENAFTNALDHAIDIRRMMSEVCRVLVDDGVFVFETHTDYAIGKQPYWRGLAEMIAYHTYNAAFWDDIRDLTGLMADFGFRVVRSTTTGKFSNFILRRAAKC
jgi:SAM-dependent methyltransferase